jgi:hypothetical protein
MKKLSELVHWTPRERHFSFTKRLYTPEHLMLGVLVLCLYLVYVTETGKCR